MMIPNRSVSSYATYVGDRDFTLTDGRMGSVSRGVEMLCGQLAVALTTERGAYPIFSQDFGIPYTEDQDALMGAIRNTLLRDERIRTVEDVKLTKERGVVSAKVTVNTIYGTCETDVTLNV